MYSSTTYKKTQDVPYQEKHSILNNPLTWEQYFAYSPVNKGCLL